MEEVQKLNLYSPTDLGAARHLCGLPCNTAESIHCLICHNTTEIPHDFIQKMWLFKPLVQKKNPVQTQN